MTTSVQVLTLLLAAQVQLETDPASRPVPPTATPMLLALMSGQVFPILEVNPHTQSDGAMGPLRVVYWAGPESEALMSVAGREQELAKSKSVFEAFRVWSVTNAIDDVSVVAAAGRPGGRGRALTSRWTRTGPRTWSAGRSDVTGLVMMSSLLVTGPSYSRDRQVEAQTTESALSFLAKLDAKKFKEAWGSASDVLHSSLPLEDFQRLLDVLGQLHGPVLSRKVLCWTYPAKSTSSAIEGTLTNVRFVTTTDGGEGVEDVVLRLESGKTWRVAGYTPQAPVTAD